MTMNKRHLKQPDDLPLWIANVRKVKLDKDGFHTIKVVEEHPIGERLKKKLLTRKTYVVFFGNTSLPVYSFDLRADSGRTISTEYVRAKTKRHVLTAAQRWWPTLKGVKDV